MKNLLLILFLSLVSFTEINAQVKDKVKKDKAIEYVDKMPEYPGGEMEMLLFLSQNIKYPKKAQLKNIEGKVEIGFVVTENGSIKNIKILKEIGDGCGIEAVRVVKLMPKWSPGMMKNKPVKVRYSLPINFTLED
jgi:protein TonB